MPAVARSVTVLLVASLATLVTLVTLVAGCVPPACSDADERSALHDVELLVTDDGPIGRAAEQRLVRRGRGAIAALETGLYLAEPPARLRIVRALGAIGSPEGEPVLRHLAARDGDPQVREAAEAALRRLTHP